MKNFQLISILLLLFLQFGCKDGEKKLGQQPVVKVQDTMVFPEVEKQIMTKPKKPMFVRAENGLNFREKPNGKILGKFIYNTQLNVVVHTGLKMEIQDEGKLIKGQWVGIKQSSDTVYVFNGFLTHAKDVSEMTNENDTYINLSELNFDDIHLNDGDTILSEKKPFEELITLKKIDKIEFNREYASRKEHLEHWDDIERKDSVLPIRCSDRIFEFRDAKIVHDEDRKEYYYLGTLSDLNLHLIRESGYEYSEYHFFDYGSCEVVKSVHGYPEFNADFTKMLTIDNDNYENSEIGLYEFVDEAFKLKMHFSLPFLTAGRSYFENEDYYFESVREWNDGIQQKISKQYFKMVFK